MFVVVMLYCLLHAAVRSSAGKELTFRLSCVLCFLVFCHFLISRYRITGQVWYLIASTHDICLPLYYVNKIKETNILKNS